jgi:hypothetical protein
MPNPFFRELRSNFWVKTTLILSQFFYVENLIFFHFFKVMAAKKLRQKVLQVLF